MLVMLQNPVIKILGWTILHSLWEITLLLSLVGLAMLILRQRTAQVRYLVAGAGLALAFAAVITTFAWLAAHHIDPPRTPPPVVSLPRTQKITLEAWDQNTVPANQASVVMEISPSATLTAKKVTLDLPAKPPVLKPVSAGLTWKQRWINGVAGIEPVVPYAAVIYLVGVGLACLRLGTGYLRLCQMRRQAIQVENDLQQWVKRLMVRMRISRSVKLLESALVEVPTVIGAFKPVILIPVAAVSGLSRDYLESLLAHELAHIRRHDYLVNMLQSAVETLLFYHPAVWWLSARIRLEREHCCDDIAVLVCHDPIHYARALESMENLRPRPVPSTGQLSLAAAGAALLPRIKRLLGIPTQPTLRRRLMSGFSGIIVVGLVVGIGYVTCHTELATAQVQKPAASQPATAPSTQPMVTLPPGMGGPGEPPVMMGKMAGMPMPTGTSIRPEEQKMMETKIGDLRMEGQKLSLVLDFLQSKANANIVANWKTIAEYGVTKDTAITTNLHDITLQQALKAVLMEASPDLEFTWDNGIIVISVRNGLAKETDQVIRVYNIRDLLVAQDNSISKLPTLLPNGNFSETEVSGSEPVKLSRIERVSEIIDLLKSSIAPSSWIESGGTIGSIRELNGQLIINQTKANQTQILKLLQKLEENHAVQIALESRLILVEEDTLQAIKAIIAKGKEAVTSRPSLSDITPVGEDVNTVLTDDQLRDIIKVVQLNKTTTSLYSPRVTTRSGQAASIDVCDSQNIIFGYKEGTSKTDSVPEIQTLKTGLSYAIMGTVTEDHTKVKMGILFQYRTLDNIEKVQIGKNNDGTDRFVQLPRVSQTVLNLAPLVPDGMTVIQGGVKLAVTVKGESQPHEKYLLFLTRPKIVETARESEYTNPQK